MHELMWVLGHPVQLLRGCLLLMVWVIVLLTLGVCLTLSWGVNRVSHRTLAEPAAVPGLVVAAPAAAPNPGFRVVAAGDPARVLATQTVQGMTLVMLTHNEEAQDESR